MPWLASINQHYGLETHPGRLRKTWSRPSYRTWKRTVASLWWTLENVHHMSTHRWTLAPSWLLARHIDWFMWPQQLLHWSNRGFWADWFLGGDASWSLVWCWMYMSRLLPWCDYKWPLQFLCMLILPSAQLLFPTPTQLIAPHHDYCSTNYNQPTKRHRYY